MRRRLSAQQRFFQDVAAAQQVKPGPRLLDTLTGETVVLAVWLGGSLRAGHTNPIFQAYRSSDGAVQDIGVLANGLTNTASIASFGAATSSNVVLHKVYEQSTKALEVVSASSTRKPLLYEHGGRGLIRGSNGYLAGDWSAGHYLSGGDCAPIAGNNEFHVAYDRDTLTANSTVFTIGGYINCRAISDTVEQVRYTGGSLARSFNALRNFAAHSFVLQHPNNATLGATTLRRDGVNLTESAIDDVAALAVIPANSGVTWGTFGSSSGNMVGLASHVIVISSALTVANRNKIENWQAAYGC
jgi:hypothetical protein